MSPLRWSCSQGGHLDLVERLGARLEVCVARPSSNAGAADPVLGHSSPGDLDLGSADTEYSGEEESDSAGTSVSTAGDGYDDILVGAYGHDDGGSDAGAAYLVLGDASPGDRDLGSADAKYLGEEADDMAGYSVATAGDVNGDAYDDILVGAPHDGDGGSDAGAAYVVLGDSSPADLDLDSADAKYTGDADSDHAGSPVSTAGDVNGDGYADILLGADDNDDGGSCAGAGAVYLVLGADP